MPSVSGVNRLLSVCRLPQSKSTHRKYLPVIHWFQRNRIIDINDLSFKYVEAYFSVQVTGGSEFKGRGTIYTAWSHIDIVEIQIHYVINTTNLIHTSLSLSLYWVSKSWHVLGINCPSSGDIKWMQIWWLLWVVSTAHSSQPQQSGSESEVCIRLVVFIV
jgi:hypothetical protein